MCQYVDHPNVAPGWGCCHCNQFNGIQNTTCKACGSAPCSSLTPDKVTGKVFENRENHRLTTQNVNYN